MKNYLFILLFLFPNLLLAQKEKTARDSLAALIKVNKFKTSADKLSALSQLTSSYMESDLVKAESIANAQEKLARQIQDLSFEADANENLGQIYYYQGRNDSALLFFNRAFNYYNKVDNPQKKFHVLNNIGNIFRNIGKFDTAIVIYNKVLSYYEKVENKEWEAKILANVGSLYYTAGNAIKAKDFTIKAIKIQRTLKDKSGLGVSLVNLMVFALNAENYKEGIKYGDEALISLKDVNKAYYASALVRVGYCYYMEKNPQKAIQYTQEALQIHKENNNTVGMMEALRTLADYYVEQEQYQNARQIGLKALQIADTTNRFEMRHIYDLLKRVSIYLNDKENALLYSGKQIKVIEEFLNKDWADKISELDAKYQSEKKEKEIVKLNSVKEIQKIWIYSLLAALLLVGVIGFFVYKNIQSKKTIAQQESQLKEQKILELEKDRQLLATQSVLKGEETERSRLARDLHDGLGGLLLSIKLSLSNTKENMTFTEDGVDQYNKALGLLDTSMKELRRVAHNMMPEALVKFGLKDALNDFCSGLKNNESNTLITFQFFGEEKRIDSKYEIGLYRIAQELINNALKYSRATDLMVQLIQETDRAHLTVQDNGKGFDMMMLKTSKGAGLANIKTRVESLNGQFDLFSEPDKGTEASVEFKNIT